MAVSWDSASTPCRRGPNVVLAPAQYQRRDSAEPSRAMHTIKKHGMGVTKWPLPLDKARNATHFGDAESVRGVAMCAAITIGTVMGGRPRSLTAIRLRNLRSFAGRVLVDGVVLWVPCINTTFREEKYADI